MGSLVSIPAMKKMIQTCIKSARKKLENVQEPKILFFGFKCSLESFVHLTGVESIFV